MKARVTVTLKPGLLDPQGGAVSQALKTMGVEGVGAVRQGKVFEVEFDHDDRPRAEAALRAACEKLLANPVMERFEVELS